MSERWIWVFRLVNGVDVLGRVAFDPERTPALPALFTVENAVRLGLAQQDGREVLVMVALSPAAKAKRAGLPVMDLRLNAAAVSFPYEPSAALVEEYRGLLAGIVLAQRVPKGRVN